MKNIGINKNWFYYIIPFIGFLTPFFIQNSSQAAIIMQGFFLTMLVFIIPFLKER